MPTIREIASRASVSPTTVSMVVNGRGTIRPSTRSRVQSAMRELGYERRPAGRPRHQKHGINIAMVYPAGFSMADGPNPSRVSPTMQWFEAVRDEMVRHGHHLSIFGGHGHVDNDPVFQELLAQEKFDGVILIGISRDGYLDQVLRAGLPTVVINRESPDRTFSSVGFNNYKAGGQVASHLLSLGHRELMVIGYKWTKSQFEDARRQGFLDVATAAGARVHRQTISKEQRQDGKEELSRDGAERVCQRAVDDGVTGVFCLTDGVARFCIDLWEEQGVAIPSRLSVVGFDHLDCASRSGLRPTSIAFDNQLIGRQAVETMIRLVSMRDQIENFTVSVKTWIAEHDTTASAPSPAHLNS